MTKLTIKLNPEMDTENMPQYVQEALMILEDVCNQLEDAKKERSKAKATYTRNKNKGAEKSVLDMLQGNVDALEASVVECEEYLEQAAEQVERVSYMDDEGGVEISHLHRFDLDEIAKVYVPVVPVLPMRGDLETEFTGRASGTTAALSANLNIEKYSDLIVGLFKTNLDATVYQKGVDALQETFSAEDIDKVTQAVGRGEREAISIVAKRKAVAINVESPGGSPSESAVLSAKIRREADKSGLPVLTFTNNMACSGGYWLLCSGDEMYSMPLANIGNIGVVGGFKKLTEWGKKRIPVQTHIITSGDEKRNSLDDLFAEATEEDIEKSKQRMRFLHERFKEQVREARCAGADIEVDEDTVFSGATFFGVQGYELGLVDGLGYYEDILEEKFGADIVQPVLDVTDESIQKMLLQTGAQSAAKEVKPEAARFGSSLAVAGVDLQVRHAAFNVLFK